MSIHCGRNKGRIASVHWIDEDGSSARTFSSTDLEGEGPRPTRILVKLWDIDIFDRLFEVTDARFLPNGQYLTVGRQSRMLLNYGIWRMARPLTQSQITSLFADQ